jgi:hypothetical protein
VKAVFAALAAVAVAAAACGVAALVTIHHQQAPWGAPPRSCGWVDTRPLHRANPTAGTVNVSGPDPHIITYGMDSMATLGCTASSSSGQAPARTGLYVAVARYPSDRAAAFADQQLRGHDPGAAHQQPLPNTGLLTFGSVAGLSAVRARGPVADLHGIGGHDAWCIRGTADPWSPAAWSEVGLRDHNILLPVWVQLAVPGQPTDPAARLWAATRIASASLFRLRRT